MVVAQPSAVHGKQRSLTSRGHMRDLYSQGRQQSFGGRKNVLVDVHVIAITFLNLNDQMK